MTERPVWTNVPALRLISSPDCRLGLELELELDLELELELELKLNGYGLRLDIESYAVGIH